MDKPAAIRVLLIPVLSMAVACQAGPGPNPAGLQTPLAPAATRTPRPTPTAIRTPPNLPAPYRSGYLNPLDAVGTYVQDTCEYLRNRWDSRKAAPGTVVMIIMLHSINRQKGEGPEAMTANLFGRMMEDLHEQRFHAINIGQLAGFLESNARIPYRSVVLIQDGRRYPDNFNAHFRQYWNRWGWPVVNAWDHQGSTTEPLWEDYVALAADGFVDFQVYGPAFSPSAKPRTDDYLTDQLQKPIEVLKERLGSVPIGVVWPNGFSQQSAQVARLLGYRLGFTFNSRGPVMYNWVPLSDASDKFRPSYQPEASVGDPLMTLPRFWPHQVHGTLDAVRIAGEESAAYAEQHKGVELEYYDIVCEATYGPIPDE
ncbi:MAG: hypothetical protein V1755_09320 [Chloroflexota bacterium]